MVKWADEVKNEVDKLHSEGKSIRQIAEKTGKSKSSIGLYIKNHSSDAPHLEINEIVPLETTAEINIPTIIENEMSINEQDANNFLQGLSVSRPVSAPVAKAGHSSFINGLMNTKVPEAEHIPRPSKARGRVALPKEPKTPKPSKLLESLISAPKEVEDPMKKPDLIGKITFNVNTFEALLTDVIKGDKDAFLKSLDKMSCPALEATLRTIETTRSVKNLTNQFVNFFYMGTSFVEVGTTQYLGMNTRGYTNMLQQTSSDEIRMILQELAMEQKDKFQKIQRPEVRLAMIMTTSLLAVNSQNSLLELRQRQQQQQQERLQPQRQPVQQQKPNTQPKPEPSEPKAGGQAKINMIIPEDKKGEYKDL
jgi:hypothetical protein